MAQFQKGQGGRPKGAKNKSSVIVQNAFSELLSDNLPQLKKDIAELHAKDRVKVLLDLAKFVVPTLKSQDHKAEIQTDVIKPPIEWVD